MFGRSCFSIFILIPLVFVSSSNAIKCWGAHLNNCPALRDCVIQQYQNLCPNRSRILVSTCTGYICKNANGERIADTACTEEVNNICQLGWDHTKIKSVARETGFQSENGKYFVFSCHKDECDGVFWTKEKIAQYKEEIKDSGFSDEQLENDGKTCKIVDGKLVDCHSPFKVITPGCTSLNQEILNDMSDGHACLPGIPSEAKQIMKCEHGKCKCLDAVYKYEVSCDNNVKKFVAECEHYTTLNEEQKTKLREKGNSDFIDVCSSTDYGYVTPSGAETNGNGFALLIASLFATFFLL